MRIFADLHIHSRYSRACSKDLSVATLSTHAAKKGVSLLGTGDFQHPEWIKELKANLTEDGTGILKSSSGMRFMLSTEIANFFSQGGKGRRVHNVLYAPDFETVDQIIDVLGKKGRLDYDGRPIFGMSCLELVELMRSVSEKITIVPAHAWTPWFGVFGSMSGFDSLQEAFGDQTKHIFAIETGLSSDPQMNRRLSALDNIALISNSDAHSYWPWRLGREANVFEFDEERLTYDRLMEAIRTQNQDHFKATVEVDPSYGKYHVDGHRACGVSYEPAETRKLGKRCPKCGKELTIGVLHRVDELADRPDGPYPKDAIPFHKIIPLSEIITAAIGANQPFSKKVWEIYSKLQNVFGSEFAILLETPREELAKHVDETIADLIIRNRQGNITVRPGFDGVYGVPIFDPSKPPPEPEPDVVTRGPPKKQRSLTEFSKDSS
ncbi:MAG: endonuclease Q family protein [Nanoarchaeota archaeon]|nr:endonuclease Q family protein [Nanoarchaeota archaeon]